MHLRSYFFSNSPVRCLFTKVGGEDLYRRLTKNESRDVTFIEDVFPKKNDVDKSLYLYEIKNEE